MDLTYEECMERLAAVKPLRRGERLREVAPCFRLGIKYRLTMDRMYSHTTHKTLWQLAAYALNSEDQNKRNLARWEALAMPLRKARDEYLDLRGLADDYKQAWISQTVGLAMLAFFTDLSILVRETPAACPFCFSSQTMLFGCDSDSWVGCIECGAKGNGDQPASDALVYWNEVAIPAAYLRLKE